MTRSSIPLVRSPLVRSPLVRSPLVRSPSVRSPSLLQFLLNIWKNYRWEFFLVSSIFIIFICWILKSDEETYRGISIDTSVLKSNPSLQRGIYKNEEKCRDVVQRIFNRPFKKSRPDFLRNPKTNRNLELDVFNEDLKIAVEYNGIQHRTYAPYFHKSPKDFEEQLQRDDFKKKRCKETGICLIVVPDTIRYHEIEEYIKSELKRNGRLW